MLESILITGGTGFIGSHTCVSLLESNYSLILIDSNCNSSPRSINGIEKIFFKKIFDFQERLKFFKGDIRDEKFLKKVFLYAEKIKKPIRSVIHFAGLKAVNESINNPMLYWDVNVGGTLNLLKIMNFNNCRTIVFSSSATIYGKNSNMLLTEKSEISPINPYGHTKATIEIILRNIFESMKDSWRIANLRYFNPIGAHPSGLIGEDPSEEPNNLFPYICRVAIGKYPNLRIYGKDWPTFDGTGIRDFVHVMDVADSHKFALEYLFNNKPQCLNLNIGTGKGTSVLELVKVFEKTNKCEIPYLFETKRSGDLASVIADNQLAKKKLKWSPQRDIVDMCRDGWLWQQKNPNGFLN